MRNFIKFLLFSLFLLLSKQVKALTVPASEDTMGNGIALLKTSGTAGSLRVDALLTTYLYFDLSLVPSDAVVRWARLRLYLPLVRNKGAGLGVHLVTGEWNEALTSGVPTIRPETLGVIEPENLASKRFVTVDVTSTVQSWIRGGTANEGLAVTPILIAGTSIASVMLPSKEGTALGLPAELDIEFHPESGRMGGQGPQGIPGLTGATGPQGATGAIGPQGIQGLTGGTGATGPQGPQGPTGPTGATGLQGIQGATGATGLDGKTVLNGTIAPAVGIGSVGDFYLNTATSSIYGPKTASG